MKIKMKQSFDMVKDQINKTEFDRIEQLTGMKMDSIIFDSQNFDFDYNGAMCSRMFRRI